MQAGMQVGLQAGIGRVAALALTLAALLGHAGAPPAAARDRLAPPAAAAPGEAAVGRDAAGDVRVPDATAAAPRIAAAGAKSGTLTLEPCRTIDGALCGTLIRPLDPTGKLPGTIPIRFEFYPRGDQAKPALGTLVAAEGGPGYPSTGSRSYYLPIFAPLLDRRDFLLVDSRGTGKSKAIDCAALQTGAALTVKAVGACGRQLGEAAAFYGSGTAADDLAAVLDALGIAEIDLYGDSYGTYFAQAFTVRHPERVRTLVLDGAYPVVGASPWYPQAAGRNRYALEITCARDPRCRARDGTTLDRLQDLLDEVRKKPITGEARDAYGEKIRVVVDGTSLAYLVFGNATGPVIFRELDAAIRAHGKGDDAALLRLIAEGASAADSRDVGFDPKYYSTGLFAAVSCTDYPQAYDMTASPARRQDQRDTAVRRKERSDPGIYAPFTIEEYLGMSIDYSVVDLCLEWPRPPKRLPPGEPIAPGAEFPKLPVLVLSGELDSITPPDGGADTAALFPKSRWLLVRNAFHVVALDSPTSCAAGIVRRFIESGGDAGDTSCINDVAAVRLVDRFALDLDALEPAAAAAGNRADETGLRLAAAAVATAGDILARWNTSYAWTGGGLRGGRFAIAATAEGYRFTLEEVRWTKDAAATGTMRWNTATGAVEADLDLAGPGGLSGRVTVAWNHDVTPGKASVEGRIAGRDVRATAPAP